MREIDPGKLANRQGGGSESEGQGGRKTKGLGEGSMHASKYELFGTCARVSKQRIIRSP